MVLLQYTMWKVMLNPSTGGVASIASLESTLTMKLPHEPSMPVCKPSTCIMNCIMVYDNRNVSYIYAK